MESKVYIDHYPKTMKMLGLERINFDCGNNTSIVTPANIAKDMVALLPDEVFIPESKFLDICCKSGIFLTSIREKLMNSKAMIESFPDDKERYKYITNNQLYGIAPNGQCQMYSVRAVYGTLKVDNPHILCFGVFDQYKTACLNNNHKMLIDEMKKEFGQMKFDVVIGNPPYNKDIYLDFVTLGHTLASKYDCWITPAKWQAKGGQKNEDFRKNIVPYMSKIVYYPDCTDVFIIQEPDGICYYLIDKEDHIKKEITNICLLNKIFNCSEVRPINNSIFIKADNIISKVKKQGETSFNPNKYMTSNYNVFTNDSIAIGGKAHKDSTGRYTYVLSNHGNFMCISKSEITEKNNAPNVKNSCLTFSSTKYDECVNFIKWTETRFVRFLFFAGLLARNSIGTDYGWRFVPAPKAFDHIFTDQELYEEYNLTPEEINIIESVIKERK